MKPEPIDIFIFLFVMSIIYILKNVLDILMNVFSSNPKEIKLTSTNKLLLYSSLSFIITFIIKLILK